MSGRIAKLEALLEGTTRQIALLREELYQKEELLTGLQSVILRIYKKTFVTCVDCKTEYDLLTHHYSIGLYDNLVFVKCPKCHKDMAIDRIDGLKRE
ncbi:MAG TPA: hypothetical protein VN944_11845 [Nitrospiria bacterium]|nr:hypothetical protein [Nitrospiria bacterium]